MTGNDEQQSSSGDGASHRPDGLTRRAVLGGAALVGAGGLGVVLGRTVLAEPTHGGAQTSPAPFDVGLAADAVGGTTREYWIQVDSFA